MQVYPNTIINRHTLDLILKFRNIFSNSCTPKEQSALVRRYFPKFFPHQKIFFYEQNLNQLLENHNILKKFKIEKKLHLYLNQPIPTSDCVFLLLGFDNEIRFCIEIKLMQLCNPQEVISMLEFISSQILGIWEIEKWKKNFWDAQSRASVGYLTSIILHEIKNPLFTLKLLGQTFKIKKNNPNFLESFDHLLNHTTTYMENIIVQFSNYGKKNYFSKVDFNKILQQVLNMVHPLFKNKNIQVQVRTLPLPLIEGNAIILESLIMNVLINAVEAVNSKGGKIKIETLVSAKNTTSSCKLPDKSPSIIFKVSNNGKTMIQNYNARMGSNNDDRILNFGLGLSICQKAVELHRGKMKIQSTASTTTFFSKLPVKID